MDIGIFDNFDDDGQMTLFGLEEDFGELPEALGEPEGEQAREESRRALEKSESEKMESEKTESELESGKEPAFEETQGAFDEAETGKQSARKSSLRLSGEFADDQGTGIRICRCSSCGKLLFVREEDGGYYSSCNACGIQYVQK